MAGSNLGDDAVRPVLTVNRPIAPAPHNDPDLADRYSAAVMDIDGTGGPDRSDGKGASVRGCGMAARQVAGAPPSTPPRATYHIGLRRCVQPGDAISLHHGSCPPAANRVRANCAGFGVVSPHPPQR